MNLTKRLIVGGAAIGAAAAATATLRVVIFDGHRRHGLVIHQSRVVLNPAETGAQLVLLGEL